MPPSNSLRNRPKFTRGEICLFVHLIITFGIIMLMTIIYFVHLCIVDHTRNEVLKIYRLSQNKRLSEMTLSDYESIGVTYVNITPATVVCNTLLLRERWSLAPAQCTSMHDDPDMSFYLLLWKIKYKINGKHIYSDIKRTLTHSQFNRGDYHNNIGLFEHAEPILKSQYYVAPVIRELRLYVRNAGKFYHGDSVGPAAELFLRPPKNIILNDEVFAKYAKEMIIVDWEIDFSKKGDISEAVINRVRSIPSEKCSTYANPIVEQLRVYEFCVTFEKNGPVADHGAMFVMDSKIYGFFSWGDIQGRGVPLIILNILHFREWFESIIFL